jgi:hypothetical protein
MALRRALQLNFFGVSFGDGGLPFLVRSAPAGEKLAVEERLWDRTVAAGEPRKAVYVADRPPVTGRYSEELHNPTDGPPGVVKLILEAGLRAHFLQAGYFVEHSGLGFFCAPETSPAAEVPSFLVFRRGLDIRVDHVTVRGQRLFGFFVSLRSRLRFNVGADDQLVGQAAMGQEVFLMTEEGVRAAVTLVERNHGVATVIDEGGARSEVPLASIRVPASPLILARYCDAIGRPELRHQVWLLGQTRTFRLLPNGQRNRKWLRDQMDQISRDLLAGSQYGKLAFSWPHSTIPLSLDVRASEAVEQPA